MGRVEIDRSGFRRQFDGKDKSWILYELLQNSWDEEGVTKVNVLIQPVPHKHQILIEIEDDAPAGFRRLADAYTLWQESLKVDDATKRGRFNEGDKKVILYAEWAKIETTTGTVEFVDDERIQTAPTRDSGSKISVIIKGTVAERKEMTDGALAVIPPVHIVTTVNGEVLQGRQHAAKLEWTLPTVQGPELRPTQRKTDVYLYEPKPGEVATVYECGIPVVETGDKYHINVMQRVPLNRERDNVTPAYGKLLRTLTLNTMHDKLPEAEFTKPWVAQAVTDKRVEPMAVNAYLDAKYTEKRVAFDPSSPESNSAAFASGHVVVFGRNEPREVWEKAREAKLIPSSSQAFPVQIETITRDKVISSDKWTDGMKNIAAYSQWVAEHAIDAKISVTFVNDSTLSCAASFGSRSLTYNVGRLGYDFFNEGPSFRVDRLLVHELGHHYSGDHLSGQYHEGLCRVGAKLKELAMRYPDKMKEFGWKP